jgi:hypothetical protein
MKQKSLERIARGRRRAQGFGALTGVMTVFAILGAVYGKDMKEEAGKLAAEVEEKIPAPAKGLIEEAKKKIGL